MKTRKQVFDLAKKLNIDILHTAQGISWDTDMWSPKGFIFASTGCHSAVTNEFVTGQNKREHWQAVWEDIKDGLEPCDIKDCDTCNDY